MNEFDRGKWYRSQALTYALGVNFPVDLSFLLPAKSMQAPEITAIMIELSGTVNSAAGTDASGSDAAKLVRNVRLKDGGGTIIDASGESLRLNEMIELGNRQVDMTTLAAGAADASRTWYIVIPFDLPKAERPRDTRLPAYHLISAGGALDISTAAALPTGWDGFTAGTITVYVHVVDGRNVEVKSRLSIMEMQMDSREFWYPVQGAIRYAVGSSVLTTTAASSWASITSIDSRSLDLPSGLSPNVLRREYRVRSPGEINSADPNIAATPLALPILWPTRDQKIGELVDLEKLHLLFNAAPPTSAVLVVSAIKNRDVELAARLLDYTDSSRYLDDMKRRGKVVSAKGKNKPASAFSASIANKLPLKITDSAGGE